jgi:MoaA/NifB/PqqE/SkfB family radical SAM enzyme
VKPLRAYTNILKLRLNMRLRRPVVRNYPVMAYIEPTSFCNLRCPACPTGLDLGLRPKDAISVDLFRAAIDEFGDYLFQLYMYNWGEPFLHKQTPEMISYAKRKHINVRISSNLSIPLTDEYIDRLVNSGLDTLVVSLDGVSEETYSRYRRRGKFELVTNNMQRIAAAKRRLGRTTPHIVWQFLVFKHNEHEVGALPSIYKEWGADSYTISGAQMPFEPYDEGFAPSTMPEYNIYDPANTTHKRARESMQRDAACSWLYGAVVLNPNGSVSPCCGTAAQKDDFGRYSPSSGFLATWNNPAYRRARGLFARHPDPSPTASPAPSPEPLPLPLMDDMLEGMGTPAAMRLTGQQLICEACPIPFMQDVAEQEIARVAHRCLHPTADVGRFNSLLRLALMGGPPNPSRFVPWTARAISRALRTPTPPPPPPLRRERGSHA